MVAQVEHRHRTRQERARARRRRRLLQRERAVEIRVKVDRRRLSEVADDDHRRAALNVRRNRSMSKKQFSRRFLSASSFSTTINLFHLRWIANVNAQCHVVASSVAQRRRVACDT